MKGKLFSILLLFIAVTAINAQDATSFYDYKMTDINGNLVDMSEFKGKKVLLVNTATHCGLTSQVSEMENLYKEYKNKDVVVVAVPSNDFGNMEPGSNEEIKEFIKEKNITFPVMAKTSVKGEDENPLYKWLTNKELNGVMDSEVSWNYQKYMIDENGKLVGTVDPKVSPASEEVVEWLKK